MARWTLKVDRCDRNTKWDVWNSSESDRRGGWMDGWMEVWWPAEAFTAFKKMWTPTHALSLTTRQSRIWILDVASRSRGNPLNLDIILQTMVACSFLKKKDEKIGHNSGVVLALYCRRWVGGWRKRVIWMLLRNQHCSEGGRCRRMLFTLHWE